MSELLDRLIMFEVTILVTSPNYFCDDQVRDDSVIDEIHQAIDHTELTILEIKETRLKVVAV